MRIYYPIQSRGHRGGNRGSVTQRMVCQSGRHGASIRQDMRGAERQGDRHHNKPLRRHHHQTLLQRWRHRLGRQTNCGYRVRRKLVKCRLNKLFLSDWRNLINSNIFFFRTAPTPTEVIADSLERTDSAAQSEFRLNKVLATPSVRKMAMEYKVILIGKASFIPKMF